MKIKYSPGFEKSLRKYNKDLRLKTKKKLELFLENKRHPSLDYLSADFTDYTDSKAKECLNLAIGACEFILKELVLFENEETLCFGYIPGEQTRVHNANMLGATLLERVYSLTKNPHFYEKSKKAMTYSVVYLNEDYSWPYGELSHHQFVDNFHTGYNLVALKEWMDYTGDNTWKEELRSACKYFLDTFWLEDGCPKYYHNSLVLSQFALSRRYSLLGSGYCYMPQTEGL